MTLTFQSNNFSPKYKYLAFGDALVKAPCIKVILLFLDRINDDWCLV